MDAMDNNENKLRKNNCKIIIFLEEAFIFSSF